MIRYEPKFGLYELTVPGVYRAHWYRYHDQATRTLGRYTRQLAYSLAKGLNR